MGKRREYIPERLPELAVGFDGSARYSAGVCLYSKRLLPVREQRTEVVPRLFRPLLPMGAEGFLRKRGRDCGTGDMPAVQRQDAANGTGQTPDGAVRLLPGRAEPSHLRRVAGGSFLLFRLQKLEFCAVEQPEEAPGIAREPCPHCGEPHEIDDPKCPRGGKQRMD